MPDEEPVFTSVTIPILVFASTFGETVINGLSLLFHVFTFLIDVVLNF